MDLIPAVNTKAENTLEIGCYEFIDTELKFLINERFEGSQEDIDKLVKLVKDRYRTQEAKSGRRNNTNSVRSVLQKMTIYEIDHLKAQMAKNFGITESEFNLIVSQLKTHETAFFERVFLTHFNDCVTYLMKNYKAIYNDAYDSTMDTMLEFRERLVQGKISYGNLRYLFTKMASQIYFRKVKSFKSQDIKESDIDIEDEIQYDEGDLNTLKKSWQELGDNCKKLLKNHFYGNQKLTEIAQESGITSATIRKQKERCMNRLRLLFEKNTKYA